MAFPVLVFGFKTLFFGGVFNFENKAPWFISKCDGVHFKVSCGLIESAPWFI